MASFQEAIKTVLKHEGGFTVDHAGATNYGITPATMARFLNTHPDNITDGLMRNLTKKQAVNIYRKLWWDRYGYGDIDSQQVATKVFDLSVNMGPGRAHRFLQTVCNSIGNETDDYVPLQVDGRIGPMTLGAVNFLDARYILAGLRIMAERFYCKLVKRNPDKYGKFLNGWLKRARA